ncbi:FG-GAP-like repeat-containing protein [Streptomyces sp. JH14]|uniref:FG-GAP-like repeat-containing protein n=1 Tax=Streptomyces sp. JH14 TaxID=2793630 RepID=UPI0023F941C1|nr:FG-GAP-like repeat-containing protein [Streptomyces sp. JH14]MDF6043405.1 FG-GAP-like repeat-containing protein [Streptomyces sp. JH14]
MVTLAVTAGVGATATGTAVADTSGDTVVVKPGARFVPRATRVLNAGETGFLTAQEGDDRLRWIDYATGAATVLADRLPKPLEYDVEAGRPVGTWPTGFGHGSDTVAIYSATPSPHVTLQQGAGGGATTTVPIPEGQSYVETYGTTVITRTGTEKATTSLHLLRAEAGGVKEQRLEGLPEGWSLTISEGDTRSVVVRGILWEGTTMKNGWWLVDLASGQIRALDAHAHSVTLGKDTLLQVGPGDGTGDVAEVFDRNDLTAPPRVLDIRNFYADSFRMLGNSLIGAPSLNGGDNEYRGQPLRRLSDDGETTEELLAVARTDLSWAPDGSVLVAGAERRTDYGPLDWGYYRFTAAADGTVTRKRVADIEDMPAQPAGISLGSGILTTADDSNLFQPNTYIGGYRSTWLKTSGRPEEIRTTVDGLTSGREADCGWTDGSYCVTMLASGDGHHGQKEGTEQADGKTKTILFPNGTANWGPRLTTGMHTPELVDLSGRFGVVNEASGGNQAIVEFQGADSGAVVENRSQTTAAVWGNTFWSGLKDSPTVSSKTLPAGAAGTSFTTLNKCVPSELQAVGRWVYWECRDNWFRGAGVYDRQTGRSVTAPDAKILLADGYFVAYTEEAGLTLFDLHNGLPTSGAYANLTNRPLVSAADLGKGVVRRAGWTVDRFGGHVAYTGDDRRVRIVPTGVPASPLSVIDTKAPGTSLDMRAAAPSWAGTWWLSKPAASWQVTVKNTASGQVVRTVAGGEARGTVSATWDGKDAAGKIVANGAYTWTLSAKPADGQGAALAVSGSVKLTGGAAVRRDFVGNDGFGDLLAFTSAGVADFRGGTGNGTGTVSSKVSGSGWTGANEVTAAMPFDDVSGDRCNDVLVRVKSGELRAYKPACGGALNSTTAYTKVGAGWNVYDALTSPGDLTGDGRADLLARETSTGYLYLYTSKGTGAFNARVKIGTGWKGYLLAGAGDLNGDGKGDLLARDSAGVLWRYAGTGTGTLATRVKVGAGWQIYNSLVGVGDASGDGKADLLARDTAGVLWAYRGDGKGLFATRVKVGAGWQMYKTLS